MRAHAFREKGERGEMGEMHHLDYSGGSNLIFVYLDIYSLYSSISPSPPHPKTHTHFIPVIVWTSHVIISAPPYSFTSPLPRLSPSNP